MVVSVQRSEVLEQLNKYTLGSIISSFAMPLCLTVFSCLILLGSFLLNRFLKNLKVTMHPTSPAPCFLPRNLLLNSSPLFDAPPPSTPALTCTLAKAEREQAWSSKAGK